MSFFLPIFTLSIRRAGVHKTTGEYTPTYIYIFFYTHKKKWVIQTSQFVQPILIIKTRHYKGTKYFPYIQTF